MTVLAIALVLGALQNSPGPVIVEETLPSIEDLSFPKLTGDFDGDGETDQAAARQGNRGVEVALTLSGEDVLFTEALGAASLKEVSWQAVSFDDLGELCGAPVGCGFPEPRRDAILVDLRDGDSFLLVWEEGALETVFLD
jgi:hypothetical protein